MITIAVKPYHHVLWRERFADRTATRLRFAREALVTTGRLVAARPAPGGIPGVFAHRHRAARGQIHGRERQENRPDPGEPPAGELPGRTMMLGQHPVRNSGRAGALHVGDRARGLVGDVEAAPPQAPAEIQILHVHEVAPVSYTHLTLPTIYSV